MAHTTLLEIPCHGSYVIKGLHCTSKQDGRTELVKINWIQYLKKCIRFLYTLRITIKMQRMSNLAKTSKFLGQKKA